MSTAETPTPTVEKAPEPAKPTVAVKNAAGQVVAEVEGETLETTSYYRKELPGANFAGLQFAEGTTFYCSNLQYANFAGANLKRATLQVCNLQGANLSNTDLRLANLNDANLCDANLENRSFEFARDWGSKFNKQTKFPKGVDPSKRRMTLVD